MLYVEDVHWLGSSVGLALRYVLHELCRYQLVISMLPWYLHLVMPFMLLLHLDHLDEVVLLWLSSHLTDFIALRLRIRLLGAIFSALHAIRIGRRCPLDHLHVLRPDVFGEWRIILHQVDDLFSIRPVGLDI